MNLAACFHTAPMRESRADHGRLEKAIAETDHEVRPNSANCKPRAMTRVY